MKGGIARHPKAQILVGWTELPSPRSLMEQALMASEMTFFYDVARRMKNPPWGERVLMCIILGRCIAQGLESDVSKLQASLQISASQVEQPSVSFGSATATREQGGARTSISVCGSKTWYLIIFVTRLSWLYPKPEFAILSGTISHARWWVGLLVTYFVSANFLKGISKFCFISFPSPGSCVFLHLCR